jgi:hydrogenase 3 maturation protease
VGLYFAEKLKKKITSDKIEIMIGGTTPENLSGVLRKMRPSHILMVDAAELGKPPGSAALVDPNNIRESGFSTHSFSLGTIARYFNEISGAKIIFLGIQPKMVAFSEGLGPEIKQAADRLVDEISSVLTGH